MPAPVFRSVIAAAAALVLIPIGLAVPAQAADNGPIVFSTGYGPGRAMIVNASPGATPVQIGPIETNRPAFAPDGRRIAATTMSGEVVTFGTDGSSLTTVATGAATFHDPPAWSPDSARLAYWVGTEPPFAVVVTSSTPGGTPQVIATISDFPGALAWSPNGSTLLANAGGEVYSFAATPGSTPVVLPVEGPTGLTTTGLSWSPDGSRIALARSCMNPGCVPADSGLWTVRADGTDAQKLVAAGPTEAPEAPSWSPDGTSIAFSDRSASPYAIKVVASSGGGQTGTAITTGEWIFGPSWGPTPQPLPVTPEESPSPGPTATPTTAPSATPTSTPTAEPQIAPVASGSVPRVLKAVAGTRVRIPCATSEREVVTGCTVTLTASRKVLRASAVVIGRGSVQRAASAGSQSVTVKAALNRKGRALAAKPGSAPIRVTIAVTAVPAGDPAATATSRTTVSRRLR